MDTAEHEALDLVMWDLVARIQRDRATVRDLIAFVREVIAGDRAA